MVLYTRSPRYITIVEGSKCSDFGWTDANPHVRIFDTMTFYNELDMLKTRLHEMNGLVEKFVIAEALYTHSGQPKELYFKNNREMFKEFEDKIVHVVVNNSHTYGGTAEMLAFQRQSAQSVGVVEGLVKAGARDDDWVIYSNVDEVPKRAVIDTLRKCSGYPTRVALEAYEYIFNLSCLRYNWYGNVRPMTKIRFWRYDQLGDVCSICDKQKCPMYDYRQLYDFSHKICPDDLRSYSCRNALHVRAAAWHMSFFMDLDRIILKMGARAHRTHDSSEAKSPEYITAQINACDHPGADGSYYRSKLPVQTPRRLPRIVSANP